jgi:hypothetical protein
VPAVAAEYWGVSLSVVWDRIYSDLVPHKTERGFVFIDVDPWNPTPSGALPHNPPATFVSADAEPDGLSTMVCDEDETFLDDCLDEDEELMLDGGDLPELDEEESATFGRLSWQEVRETVSRTRRPPPKMQKSS